MGKDERREKVLGKREGERGMPGGERERGRQTDRQTDRERERRKE